MDWQRWREFKALSCGAMNSLSWSSTLRIVLHRCPDPGRELFDGAQVIQLLRQLEGDTLSFRHTDECPCLSFRDGTLPPGFEDDLPRAYAETQQIPVGSVEANMVELKRPVFSKRRRFDFEPYAEDPQIGLRHA